MAEMSKSPEEIKEGMEWCFTIGGSCTGCPYGNMRICGNKLGMDALAYIQQLEQIALHWQSSMDQVQKALQDNGFQNLEELLQAYSQAKRERDAGVEDMKKMSSCRCGVRCAVCRYRKGGSLGPCERCIISDSWEWRGVPEPTKQEGGTDV